jgi:hypothetical protein
VSRAVRKGARVEWRDDLIVEGDEGTPGTRIPIRSNTRVGVNHGIAQDGRVAVLTVDYAP